MSDTRTTESSPVGEIPPRPDVSPGQPSGSAFLGAEAPEPAEHGSVPGPAPSPAREAPPQAPRATPAPFEPVSSPETDVIPAVAARPDIGAEPPAAPVLETAPPPGPAEEAPEEPKRRRWRKRKEPKPEPQAEVPLEQARVETVPGPRGMFERDADDGRAAPTAASIPPAPGETLPQMRPDMAPVTSFEREIQPAEPPEQAAPSGPVIVPQGHYRLPDDFAFGPGGKPEKAKRKA